MTQSEQDSQVNERFTPSSDPHQADWRYDLSLRIAIADAAVLVVTTTMSILLRFGFSSSATAVGPFTITYPAFGTAIILAWWLTLSAFRTRDPRLLGAGVLEYRRVVRATVMMFGCLAIASVLFKWDMSRGFLAITFPLGLVGLLAGRKAGRVWLRRERRAGRSVSRSLVVGGPAAASRLAHTFNGNPSVGMLVCGVWVPDAARGMSAELVVRTERIPVLGEEHDIMSALAAVRADTVIVTDSEHLGPEGMRELTWQLEGVDVDLMVSPNLVDISAPRMYLGPVGGEPFIHLDQPQYAEAGTALKGFFDAALGSLLLVLASPLLLAAAVAVKVTTKGPILFKQVRIGRNGTPFEIFKFRTMSTGADAQLRGLLDQQGRPAAPLFKIKDDPRITPVGRFLRRYSIDELPQFINVIRGDMSLVGPRPQRDVEVSMYDHKAHRRLAVRPGMTGLWQVSGRSNLTWEQSVRLDLYYVENWSMTGDLVILWKTLRAVIRSEGAY